MFVDAYISVNALISAKLYVVKKFLFDQGGCGCRCGTVNLVLSGILADRTPPRYFVTKCN
jgi:hypothetical protein